MSLFKNNEWKPFDKQSEFLTIPPTVKEAMYGGGVNTAKTETIVVFPIVHKYHEHPRFKMVIMRRTHPELKREVLPRARRMYRPFGATFNGQDMAFTFPSGAMVFLGHCENEDDVHKYDSMEINVFAPDEVGSLTEYQYLYLAFERVRAPLGSGLPAIIRCAGMPGGIGHGWVKKRFVDPCPEGGKIIEGRGGNERMYIHAVATDNPYTDPSYLQSLDALPEAERQARKFGNWNAYLGQVFDEFRDKHYPDEPENALHVVEPFDIPDYWPRIISMDWGYNPPAMTCVLYAAISPDGRVVVYREDTFQKTKIEVWCNEIKPFVNEANPKVVMLCQSASQVRGQEHTIHQQITDALGRPIQLSGNAAGSRIAGKMLFHEYLRWRPKPVAPITVKPYDQEFAVWLMRNGSLKEYHSYLKQYELPQPENNLPKLLIFAPGIVSGLGCPKFIESIKMCVYEKAKEGKAPEDVAEFPGDDPYDAGRYLLDAADRYVNESEKEFEKVQKQQEIVQEFQRTGDYNYLFRNAAVIDGTKKKSFGVSRYHH